MAPRHGSALDEPHSMRFSSFCRRAGRAVLSAPRAAVPGFASGGGGTLFHCLPGSAHGSTHVCIRHLSRPRPMAGGDGRMDLDLFRPHRRQRVHGNTGSQWNDLVAAVVYSGRTDRFEFDWCDIAITGLIMGLGWLGGFPQPHFQVSSPPRCGCSFS